MNSSNQFSAYIPIDCNYYDKIEETIILKKTVQLVYLDDSGQEQSLQTKLADTHNKNGEEFVLLPDRSQIRMDKIISIDGDEAPRERHC